MSDRISSPQDPTRILILTFVLAAFALVGLTVLAFSQLKRARSAAVPTMVLAVERATEAVATPAPLEPVVAKPAAPLVAARRREKAPPPARKPQTPSLSDKLGKCTDPMCGLPLE